MSAYIFRHAPGREVDADRICRFLDRFGFSAVACVDAFEDPALQSDLAGMLTPVNTPHADGALFLHLCEGEGGQDAPASDRHVALPASALEADSDTHGLSRAVHALLITRLCRSAEGFSLAGCAVDAAGYAVCTAVLAHRGDADAAYRLAGLYEEGRGLPRMETEAVHWMARAAELGSADARIGLGIYYLDGRGLEADPAEALCLFASAAEAGDVRGEYHIGLCYLQGLGVLKDAEVARDHLLIAARADYAPALYRLGLAFSEGHTVRDRRIAAACLYRACLLEAGDPARLPAFRPRAARFTRVSIRHMSRLPHTASRRFTACPAVAAGAVTPVEPDPLSEHFGTIPPVGESYAARSRVDVAAAATALGQLLAEGGPAAEAPSSIGGSTAGLYPRPMRAMAWYRYAVAMGSAEAAYRLGEAYRRGLGAPADPGRALDAYRTAAARGHMAGQFALGVCYERGIGTSTDLFMAARLYEQAARAGYAPAQNNVGGCYEHGLGVVADQVSALEWYARAADADQPNAICRLGLAYECGRGVAIDRERAIKLYERAVTLGHAYAMYRLGLCYDHEWILTSEDRSAAATEARSLPRRSQKEIRTAEEERALTYISGNARAASLWQRAADAGVADAAYALSLCYKCGRGTRQDGALSLKYLRLAADRGHIQALYRLGRCYLGGIGVLRDDCRARDCFARAVEQWQIRHEAERRQQRAAEAELIPTDAMTPDAAASGALYMLGYCTLYGSGSETADAATLAQALAYFRQAADEGHVGALTAIGDLYAGGCLCPESGTAADAALDCYIEAVRTAIAADDGETDPENSPIHARMSLSERAMAHAAECLREGDVGEAEQAFVQAWRSMAGSAELGSADALVGMAAAAYHGQGTPENHQAAIRFLERAEAISGGRVAASLWRGDCLRIGAGAPVDLAAADAAYLRALAAPAADSECGPYIMAERRRDRLERDTRARAEVLYRLATLRAVHTATPAPAKAEPDVAGSRTAFAYLADAVLMGHESALDDLSRMYAFETAYVAATASAARGEGKEGFRFSPAALRRRRALRRLRAGGRETPTHRDGRAPRSHAGWLNDYYTALWPEPIPFAFAMHSAAVRGDPPAYVSWPVTDIMRAAAIGYLGDCFFYGQDLPRDPDRAVACYRRVAEMRIDIPCGEPAPTGVVWAQYSLGWCLLHGVGCPKNAREAVGWLTRAARSHAEACYALGDCHERGIGVDGADDREAVKYYRKALRLGLTEAEEKVDELERRLADEA